MIKHLNYVHAYMCVSTSDACVRIYLYIIILYKWAPPERLVDDSLICCAHHPFVVYAKHGNKEASVWF